MGALFEHVDDAGDRLAVTEPSEGGLTFHCLMDPDWRPGEVWLDPAAVLELRNALDAWLGGTAPLPEWACPSCGATTRARMADQAPVELRADRDYLARCLRASSANEVHFSAQADALRAAGNELADAIDSPQVAIYSPYVDAWRSAARESS